MTHDVVVTGIGLVSTLGEGLEAHAALFNANEELPAAQPFGPFFIHPLCDINFDLQIPKKGDQRQMEPWQRIGVYAAGLALQNAGLAGKHELLAKTHMIVAAGGGERDEMVDNAIMSGIRNAPNKGAYLNEQLMNDLRPTLFLTQLTNLLAGNISIVHGVAGSSRSFMGEEAAGIDAIRTLYARIASGQVELGLAGGANNALRKETLLSFAFEDWLLRPPYAPVWSRKDKHAGAVLGSMGAFLVLEERGHALSRNAKIFARLTHAASTRCSRKPNEVQNNLQELYAGVEPRLKGGAPAVLSCACGIDGITQEEESFWLTKNAALRAIDTVVGHGLEAQAPFACALATLSLSMSKFPAPFETKEKPLGSAEQILVSCCGHWRGEGLLLLEREAA